MKIYTANFEVKPMNISYNFEQARAHLKQAIEDQCEIIVFPQGFLLGTAADVLLGNKIVMQQYNGYIDKLCCGLWISKIYILCDRIVDNKFENTFYFQGENLNTDVVNIQKSKVCGVSQPSEIFDKTDDLRKKADVFLLNWSKQSVAGQVPLYIAAAEKIAQNTEIAFVFCLGGRGYTTHPHYFKACIGMVCQKESDITTGFTELENAGLIYQVAVSCPLFSSRYLPISIDFEISYNQNPLIPKNVNEQQYCLEIFEMQTVSLAYRMKNIGCKDLVLNLSGGLDSSLALLVCTNVFDILNLDKSGLHVVTMPSFGTSDKTKQLATDLCKSLGVKLDTVDITSACKTALENIGHDTVTGDVVFENVQARMRTLNALNLANKYNALMVGTGDLSEEALGFSTYGGDQMANYNINNAISKTVIRTMLLHLVQLPTFTNSKDTITEILNIPVSPELLPCDGKILQKTEDILAPYKLIDFYIYCFIITKISPKETIEKAKKVFKDEFSEEYLTQKLAMFYKKYAIGQFKRSASPESANITHASLYGQETFYPSDASADLFVDIL